MDKVIDGVDVSDCEFIGDIKNKFVKCTSWVHNSKKQVSGHWDCRENKNCYYKQLKRLEQENEQLHNDLKECGIKREQYRQTLQDIRDIAKEGSKSVFADEDCDKILDKINEVIGAE